MSQDMKEKLEKYRTAPFDARFPNQNQTRNCWQNYLDFHRCQKALTAKGTDVTLVIGTRGCINHCAPYPGCLSGMSKGRTGHSLEKSNTNSLDLHPKRHFQDNVGWLDLPKTLSKLL